jgi:hypothetical protein
MRLPDSQLNGIRRGLNQRVNRFFEAFNAAQKGGFAKKSVVDGDIETMSAAGVKKAI